MKQTFMKVMPTLILCMATYYANAQGCSDAGFCTINSLKPNYDGTALMYKNQIKIGTSLGNADNSISIFGNYMEYSRQVSSAFGIDAKITTLSQSGNGISNFAV